MPTAAKYRNIRTIEPKRCQVNELKEVTYTS